MKDKISVEKLEHDCNLTSSNYAQMHDRFLRRHNLSSFYLIYYSIFAIITSLIPKFFTLPETLNNVLDFGSICISIIILIVSIQVSLARYSERMDKAIRALDGLKRLKKELETYREGLSNEDYEEKVNVYHSIVDNMELRAEIDFYKTCKKIGNEELYKRFSMWDILSIMLQQFAGHILNFFLFIAPILFYGYLFL